MDGIFAWCLTGMSLDAFIPGQRHCYVALEQCTVLWLLKSQCETKGLSENNFLPLVRSWHFITEGNALCPHSTCKPLETVLWAASIHSRNWEAFPSNFTFLIREAQHNSQMKSLFYHWNLP